MTVGMNCVNALAVVLAAVCQGAGQRLRTSYAVRVRRAERRLGAGSAGKRLERAEIPSWTHRQ